MNKVQVLNRFVNLAKTEIVQYLTEKTSSKRPPLERHILDVLSFKEKKDGTISHEYKPIHDLAFVLAYKNLEVEDKIKIERPTNVPYSMTNFETLFSLN